MQPKADTLFEISWEVCNKVGGICTVIQSKAELVKELYNDYFLVGPYFEEKARLNFKKTTPPEDMKAVFDEVEELGIICHSGRWLIKGEPDAILIEVTDVWTKRKDEFKKAFWEKFSVDTLFANFDYDEPLMWATAVGELLSRLSAVFPSAVVQSHEWLAGIALLSLKIKGAKMGTVFTTHATMLGRAMCGAGRDLYDELGSLDPQEEAKAFKVSEKFTTERACALNADVFTTVSEITALEAENMFGKRPDVLLYNGLDQDKFPSFEEAMIRHRVSRETIREYLSYHFFPYYFFDTEHTLIYFIVARNEFRNKGMDVLIESLSKVNEKLKREKSERTIVVFFWIPNQTFGIKVELLENKTFYRQIEYSVDSCSAHIKRKLISSILSQKRPEMQDLLPEEFKTKNKRLFMHFKRGGNPPILTHNMHDEQNDVILKALIGAKLDNHVDDRVKVIYSPIYLDGADGLINLNYYDALAGCHMGIFPSYYEPWGYTPQECMSFGVPAVTTDQAGFGRFIQDYALKENLEDDGIFIIKRTGRGHEEVVKDLAEVMYSHALRGRPDRIINRINAKKLAGIADWKEFIKNYITAHDMAYDKAFGR